MGLVGPVKELCNLLIGHKKNKQLSQFMYLVD